MKNYKKIDHVVNYLLNCYDEMLKSPFPYVGCHKILSGTGERFEGFIPDLDLYFFDIASHSGGAKELRNFSTEKLKKSQMLLSIPFFEKHPQYNDLKPRITYEDTPDLSDKIKLYESSRILVLELIDLIR